MANYLAVCLGFILVLGVAQAYITIGPANTAAMPNTTIVLRCECSAPIPQSRIHWIEYVTTQTGQIISDGAIIASGHPNSARYSILHVNATQFDLQITGLTDGDGGAYECFDDSAQPPATEWLGADVIVIDGNPICTDTLPDLGIVIEGQYNTIECTVYYHGRVGPNMTWTGPEPHDSISSTTPTSTLSGVGFTANRTMENQPFTCVTNYTSDGFTFDGYATNAPTYYHSYTSQTFLVEWGPKNMYYAPVKASYEIGENITCFCDADPAPSYYWQSLNTTVRTNGQSFTTSDTGLNYMRCHAENLIDGSLYTLELVAGINVNPITTTTPPTPPPTTTRPAPVGDCDNLTGQWESGSSDVRVCLYVNTTNKARINGLVRMPGDVIWLKLAGRTLNTNFGQIGVSAIDADFGGVTSFVGECHKCFGVESLIVNYITRNIDASLACGVASEPDLSPSTTTLQRAATITQPCSSLIPQSDPVWLEYRSS